MVTDAELLEGSKEAVKRIYDRIMKETILEQRTIIKTGEKLNIYSIDELSLDDVMNLAKELFLIAVKGFKPAEREYSGAVLSHEDAEKILLQLQGIETRTPEQIKANEAFLKECKKIVNLFDEPEICAGCINWKEVEGLGIDAKTGKKTKYFMCKVQHRYVALTGRVKCIDYEPKESDQ